MQERQSELDTMIKDKDTAKTGRQDIPMLFEPHRDALPICCTSGRIAMTNSSLVVVVGPVDAALLCSASLPPNS